jgi:hypothetical protein
VAQLGKVSYLYDGCNMMFVPLWVNDNLINVHTRIKFSNSCQECNQRFPCNEATVFKLLTSDPGNGFVRTWFDLDDNKIVEASKYVEFI